MACIKDINPASDHHYLIIPKNHIVNAKVLNKEHEELCEYLRKRMLVIGMLINSVHANVIFLDDKIVATVDTIVDQLGLEKNSTRTGFHWPPFTTVGHLHLHVISPVEKMGFIKNMMFKPNSHWFVSVSYVVKIMLDIDIIKNE